MCTPETIARLIGAVERRRAALPDAYQGGDSIYAAADPWAILTELRKHAVSGRPFLEWGSGLGTVTIMASLLGYEACGIEQDAILVEQARCLAAELGGLPRFVVGDYWPRPARPDDRADAGLHGRRPAVEGPADVYSELGRRLSDFEVVYVFPWPDEIDRCYRAFAAMAGPQARLLVYSQTAEVLQSVRQPGGCTSLCPA